MKYKGSSSGGPHRDPTSDPKTIDKQIGYGTKYGETTTTSIWQWKDIWIGGLGISKATTIKKNVPQATK